MRAVPSAALVLALSVFTGCPDSGVRVPSQSESKLAQERPMEDAPEDLPLDEEPIEEPDPPKTQNDETLSQALPTDMRAGEQPFSWANAPLSGGLDDAKLPEEKLLGFLEHEHPKVRQQAAWALFYRVVEAKTRLSLTCEQALIAHLDDSELAVRSQIAVALSLGGSAASNALLEVARKDSATRVRVSAISSLTVLERTDQGDAPAVFAFAVEALNDPDPNVREPAVWLLRDLQHDLPATAKALLDALHRETQANSRASLIVALGDCGEAAIRAVPTLIAELNGKGDVYLRRSAGIALGQIGGGDALKALQAQTENPEAWVRLGVLKGLIFLEDPGHEQAFVACLNELNADRGWIKGTEGALLAALSADELRVLNRFYRQVLDEWKAKQAGD